MMDSITRPSEGPVKGTGEKGGLGASAFQAQGMSHPGARAGRIADAIRTQPMRAPRMGLTRSSAPGAMEYRACVVDRSRGLRGPATRQECRPFTALSSGSQHFQVQLGVQLA